MREMILHLWDPSAVVVVAAALRHQKLRAERGHRRHAAAQGRGRLEDQIEKLESARYAGASPLRRA